VGSARAALLGDLINRRRRGALGENVLGNGHRDPIDGIRSTRFARDALFRCQVEPLAHQQWSRLAVDLITCDQFDAARADLFAGQPRWPTASVER
jgi:hypothetical protein